MRWRELTESLRLAAPCVGGLRTSVRDRNNRIAAIGNTRKVLGACSSAVGAQATACKKLNLRIKSGDLLWQPLLSECLRASRVDFRQ
jgi:hypothetical protein